MHFIDYKNFTSIKKNEGKKKGAGGNRHTQGITNSILRDRKRKMHKVTPELAMRAEFSKQKQDGSRKTTTSDSET